MLGEVFRLGIVVNAVDHASATIGRIGNEVEKLGGKSAALMNLGLQNMAGGAVTAGIGAAIAAPVLAAVPAAMRFEHRMAEVRTMTSGAADEMDRLSRGVLRLSGRYGQDQDVMGQALYNILSAGVPAAHSLDVLSLSAQAAIAGVTDVNTAATLGTNILNAYKLPVGELGHVYDILFQTVKSGVTTFPELSASMGEITSIAAAAHVPLNQLGASVAVLTQAGIKTPQAMTAMRGLIQALAAPSSAAGKQLRALGGSALDAAMQSGDLIGAIRILSSKTGSLAAIRKIIPEMEGAKGFAALVANLEKLQELSDQMGGGRGAMAEAFDKMMESPLQQWEILKKSLGSLGITIGRELLPVVSGLLKAITPVVQKVADWLEKHPTLTRWIVRSVAAIGGLLFIVGSARMGLGALQFVIGAGTKGLAGMEGTVGLLGKALRSLNPVTFFKDLPGMLTSIWSGLKACTLQAWAFVRAAASNPYVWAAIGIIALITLTVIATRRTKEMVQNNVNIFQGLHDLFVSGAQLAYYSWMAILTKLNVKGMEFINELIAGFNRFGSVIGLKIEPLDTTKATALFEQYNALATGSEQRFGLAHDQAKRGLLGQASTIAAGYGDLWDDLKSGLISTMEELASAMDELGLKSGQNWADSFAQAASGNLNKLAIRWDKLSALRKLETYASGATPDLARRDQLIAAAKARLPAAPVMAGTRPAAARPSRISRSEGLAEPTMAAAHKRSALAEPAPAAGGAAVLTEPAMVSAHKRAVLIEPAAASAHPANAVSVSAPESAAQPPVKKLRDLVSQYVDQRRITIGPFFLNPKDEKMADELSRKIAYELKKAGEMA